jgi:hypothetical protein
MELTVRIAPYIVKELQRMHLYRPRQSLRAVPKTSATLSFEAKARRAALHVGLSSGGGSRAKRGSGPTPNRYRKSRRTGFLPSAPDVVTWVAHAFRQIVILSDDAEQCIAYPWKHRVGRELSDAIRLFAIMVGKFYGEIGHSRRNMGGG